METPDLNDELKKISVDGLKQLGDWIHQAKDFAVEQAPLFAQEYARWWTASHLILAISYFVMIGPLLWLATKGAGMTLALEAKQAKCDQDSWWTFSGCVLRIGFTIGCFVCFFEGTDALTAASKGYFAPRVVLVEGIREIVKGTDTSCQGGKR